MTYITVDVDLSEFSDEELRDELAERDAEYHGGMAFSETIREIYDLLHMGKDERAFAVMKTFICNETGRIL